MNESIGKNGAYSLVLPTMVMGQEILTTSSSSFHSMNTSFNFVATTPVALKAEARFGSVFLSERPEQQAGESPMARE